MANKKPGIHIKKSTKGSFTRAAKRAGKSVQAEARAALANPKASPAMKKKANTAQQAAIRKYVIELRKEQLTDYTFPNFRMPASLLD